MSLLVRCNGCLTPFDAEMHAGLVRCPPCTEASCYRLPGRGAAGRTVVL